METISSQRSLVFFGALNHSQRCTFKKALLCPFLSHFHDDRDIFISVLSNNVAGSWTPSSTTPLFSITWLGRTRDASWSPSAAGKCLQPRDTASRCPRVPAGNDLLTWRCCSSSGTVGTQRRSLTLTHSYLPVLHLHWLWSSPKESLQGRVNILPNSVASSEYHYLHHTLTHVMLIHTHLPWQLALWRT